MRHCLIALLLALSTALTGCISYSQHQLPVVEAWPPLPAADAAPAHKTAYVRFNTLYEFNGQPRASNANLMRFEKTLVQSYEQSERFTRVTSEKVDSDVYAYVTLRNNEQGNVLAATLTGATLFIIPSTFDNTLTLETLYKDREGKLIGKVSKSETITTWMQLLLIFAVPFNDSGDAIIEHLSRSSVEEAIRRKLI